MNNDEMMALLKDRRSSEWNDYRKRHPNWCPDLSGKDLTSVNLIPDDKPVFDFSKANLCGTRLPSYSFIVGGGRKVIVKDAKMDINTVSLSLDLIQEGAVYISESDKFLTKHSPIAFISYTWADDDVVLAVEAWMRNKGLETKIDKRDFFAGSRIRDEITRVMIQCDVILIFYSKKSETQAWPQFERELASDIEMEAKKSGFMPPRIIYIVIDNAKLPSVSESNRLAIMASGKRFELVCEEIYHAILQLPKPLSSIDLAKWSDYIF